MSENHASHQEGLQNRSSQAADDSPAQQAGPQSAAAENPSDERAHSGPADSAGDDLDSALADADAARQLNDVSTELADAQNQVRRAQAELENFRKRVRREMEIERRFAAVPLVSDLLPVLDNLQRAIAAAGNSEAAAGLVEGVKMVAGQFLSVLEKHDCRAIDPLGQVFDPNLHEAIAQQPAGEAEPGTVLHVAQVGYTIHDRVVRPAQVVVAAAPQAEAAPAESKPEQ